MYIHVTITSAHPKEENCYAALWKDNPYIYIYRSQFLPSLAESTPPPRLNFDYCCSLLCDCSNTFPHGSSVLTMVQGSHEDLMGTKIQLRQPGLWKQLDSSLKMLLKSEHVPTKAPQQVLPRMSLQRISVLSLEAEIHHVCKHASYQPPALKQCDALDSNQ